jgi:hypothetical protein
MIPRLVPRLAGYPQKRDGIVTGTAETGIHRLGERGD